MYTNAKPFFLGLIVGDAAAAGFWLAMGIVPERDESAVSLGEHHAGLKLPNENAPAV